MTGVFEGTTGSSKTITFANKVNYSNPLSHEFTFLGAKGYTGWEFGSIRGDAKDQSTYHIPTDESGKAEKEAYVADGVLMKLLLVIQRHRRELYLSLRLLVLVLVI